MPEYVLEIVEGPEAGRRIALNGPLELGRDSTAGAPLLQDELISRRHVRITPEEDGARVEDLESRNGTFVDGDQIFSPAHLAVDGQLLVGVSVLQLRLASEAAGHTAVRPIPTSLTVFRPLPAEAPDVTAVRQVPSLAVEESEPDYVPANALEAGTDAGSGLLPLLDMHTKSKARGAPIGIFVLVALAVILYLALR